MPSSNRRDFLATTMMATAGLAMGVRRADAMRVRALPLQSRLPVSKFAPDVVDAETLRRLAQQAMEAAKSAGATYADIRIADRRMFTIGIYQPPVPSSSIGFEYSYGIRAQVDGAWAFAYGADPSPAGVTQTAQAAVTTARSLTKLSGPKVGLAPAPVATGEWTTPIRIDPFAISPNEHGYMLGAYMNAAGRVFDGGMMPEFKWSSETRVFASTEGSLVTQHLAQFVPGLTTMVGRPIGLPAMLPFGELKPTGVGFEAVLGTDLQDQIKANAEETARWLGYPEGEADVGRFQAVFDGQTTGAVVAATLLPALELERVLGRDANGAGTSFLAPPDEILNGAPLFGNVLTVSADRANPNYGGVKWDDDGVEPDNFPVIQNGKVVDYFTTRDTAPSLANWYAKQGKSVKSHGCSVTGSPTRTPVGMPVHVSVATGSASLDDLTKRLTDGVLIRGTGYVSSDHQLVGGSFYPPMIFEVKKGKITRRLKNAGLQFSTKTLWKSITAVGDANTVQIHTRHTSHGQPASVLSQVVAAPAAHVREINLIQLGRNR